MLLSGCGKSESSIWTPRQRAQVSRNPPVPETNNEDSLDQRFHDQLREDKGVELKDIPLLQLTRSVIWWLEMVCQYSKIFQSYLTSDIYQGRNNERDAPTPGTLRTLQYINLRKASWIANGLEKNENLRNRTDDRSFWYSYCQKLKKVRQNFSFQSPEQRLRYECP